MDKMTGALLNGLIVVAIVGIIFIVSLVVCDIANAADHAVVSFNNADHLTALQDSVVGVCDTTWIDGMRFYSPFPRDTSWIQGAVRHGLMTITCRRLAGMTVTKQSKQQGCVVTKEKVHKTTGMGMPLWDPAISHTRDVHTATVGTPGEAIIFYEPSK